MPKDMFLQSTPEQVSIYKIFKSSFNLDGPFTRLINSLFTQITDSKDFLCETLLTDTQHVQLGSLRLLATLISFDRRETPDMVAIVGSLEVGMDSDYVKSKMLQRVSVDYFDPALPLDVHIVSFLVFFFM